MITVKRLKQLLERYPDDATVNAGEGDRNIGIAIWHGYSTAWIETGDCNEPADETKHRLVLEAQV